MVVFIVYLAIALPIFSHYLQRINHSSAAVLDYPHTTISLDADTQETFPDKNLVLAIIYTNDGNQSLMEPSVLLNFESVLMNLRKMHPYYVGGDENNDGILDPGESWKWEFGLMIPYDVIFAADSHGYAEPAYEDIVSSDSITVKTTGVTRTSEFWGSHTLFASYVYNNYFTAEKPLFIGQNVDAAPGTHKGIIKDYFESSHTGIGELFGGFYASFEKNTEGKKRNAINNTRIILLRQILAAKLNCAAFGCSVETENLIAEADQDYFLGHSKKTLLDDAKALAIFNNSGNQNAISGNLPPTFGATSQDSINLADFAFWDAP